MYGLLPLSWQWLVGGLLVGGCTFPGLLWDSSLLLFISFCLMFLKEDIEELEEFEHLEHEEALKK